MPRCPRRRVVRRGRWTGDLDPWSLWWTRPSRSPPSRCLRRRIACSRAPTALSVPRAAAGGPADDPAGEQVRDEGGAAEPRPGRHVGEVDHPAPVRAGGGGSRGAAGRAGTGFPLAGPVVRTVLPGPAPVSPSARMRRSTVHRAAPGPSCRVLSSRQVFLDPSVALNGSALRARILSSRAASEIDLLEGGRDRAA